MSDRVSELSAYPLSAPPPDNGVGLTACWRSLVLTVVAVLGTTSFIWAWNAAYSSVRDGPPELERVLQVVSLPWMLGIGAAWLLLRLRGPLPCRIVACVCLATCGFGIVSEVRSAYVDGRLGWLIAGQLGLLH